MSAANNGGPAFPNELQRNMTSGYLMKGGMTLRDYFAAKAMQSIISTLKFGIQPSDLTDICFDCYLIADAMLAEREKGGAK